MAGQADAVVGHPVLGEVVGADLLRPLPRAHLRTAHRPHLRQPLPLLPFVQSGPQDSHRPRTVLELGALALAGGDYPSRRVGDAYSSRALLHVLPARPGGPVDVYSQIVGVNFHFYLVHLWQDGHGCGGGVDAPAGFGDGHPLHSMHAALVFQPGVGEGGRPPLDGEDDLFEPAYARLVETEKLGDPTVALGILVVHAIEVGCEQARLIAPCPGSDLHDHVPLIPGILR